MAVSIDRAAKTIVITGASDGVGAAAAQLLVADGHRVVIVGRSPEKTEAVSRRLGCDGHVADFADLSQVRRLAEAVGERYPRIDVLANNAGGLMGARQVTVDGHEKTFQVNHLAPFLLTTLLLPTLTASNAAVLQTSSKAAALWGRKFDIDDLDNEHNYSAQRAYGRGKLANILFTRELHRRYAADGLAAAAFHPGVVRSNFASEGSALVRFFYRAPVLRQLFTISPTDGAAPLVWLAQGEPGRTWTSGEYYEKNAVATDRSAPQATNPDLAERLWDRSESMVAQ